MAITGLVIGYAGAALLGTWIVVTVRFLGKSLGADPHLTPIAYENETQEGRENLGFFNSLISALCKAAALDCPAALTVELHHELLCAFIAYTPETREYSRSSCAGKRFGQSGDFASVRFLVAQR